MQTFKTFFKIAKKNLPSCILYLGIYLVIMILMSFLAKDSNDSQFQSSSLDIGIIDCDDSKASHELTDYLDEIHTIVPLENDGEVIQDSLFYRKVSYVLTIPKGFEKNLLDGKSKNLIQTSKRKDSASGYFLDEQVDQYLKTMRLYLCSGDSITDAAKHTADSAKDIEKVTSLSFEKDHSSSDNLYYYFQYMPYILILLLTISLAPILIIFRKKDIENRMDCAPISPTSKGLALSIGCALYCLAIWGFFILIGRMVYGADMFSKNGLLCILNSFVFLLITLAITLLVSTFSPNTNVLNMIANVLGLGMSFLCGIFVPQAILSDNLLQVSRFLPAYWYVRITNMFGSYSAEPFSMNFYWKAIGIQLLFFVAIFAIYLVANKQHKSGANLRTSK